MNNLKQVFKSWRFWSVFLIGLGTAVEGLTNGEEFVAVLIKFITVIAGGAAAVRTIDRFGEKVGEIYDPEKKK